MYFCRSLLELNISYDYFSISELGLRKSKYPNIYLNSKKKIYFFTCCKILLQNLDYEIKAIDKWCQFPNCCFS